MLRGKSKQPDLHVILEITFLNMLQHDITLDYTTDQMLELSTDYYICKVRFHQQ